MWRSLSLGDSREERGLKYGCCMLKMCVRQIMCTIGCYCPQERETKGFSRSPSRHHQQPCYVCEKFQIYCQSSLPCFPSHHYSTAVGRPLLQSVRPLHSLKPPCRFPMDYIFLCPKSCEFWQHYWQWERCDDGNEFQNSTVILRCRFYQFYMNFSQFEFGSFSIFVDLSKNFLNFVNFCRFLSILVALCRS